MLPWNLGEHDHSEPVIVGGAFPTHTILSAKSGLPDLGKENLAQVHQTTLVKHIDCSSGGFAIQQIPRRVIDAMGELKDLAETLLACVNGNSGVPPLLLALDAHESYTFVHSFCLGILPFETYESLPVLSDCVPTTLGKIPCFQFKYMLHSPTKQPLLGCLDPKHLMKSWSRALRSPSRILEMFLGDEMMLQGMRQKNTTGVFKMPNTQ